MSANIVVGLKSMGIRKTKIRTRNRWARIARFNGTLS